MEKEYVVKGAAAALKGASLIDLVFSWSISDLLNRDLYKDKVKEIPKTFTSTCQYMNSFVAALIEETHADLLSGLATVPQAPLCEVLYVEEAKNFKPPNDLFYNIALKKTKEGNVERYKPEGGDIFALTDVRPKCIDDLDRPSRPYLIASVIDVEEEDLFALLICSSAPIVFGHDAEANSKRVMLFAVFLTNMVTNSRIWNALNMGLTSGNLNIIKSVLQIDSTETCAHSLPDENCSDVLHAKDIITPFNLNESQQSAIFSCVSTRKCYEHNHLKLIWGPPGTGKTKTVGSLLFVLLGMKCRTLTCAPTNISLMEVTSRLLNLVMDSPEYDTYGLGDVVLFGNAERMKIADHDDLFDVFLDYRADMLAKCFAPFSGWKHSLRSMISLLEDPEGKYHSYLEIVKQNEKEKEERQKHDNNTNKKCDKKVLTFEEYMMKNFNRIGNQLKFCIKTSYTHLPTSFISAAVVNEMIRAHNLLVSLSNLLGGIKIAGKKQKQCNLSSELSKTMKECLHVLEYLSLTFTVPDLFNKHPHFSLIKKFCMKHACLIFCTASSSGRLQTEGMAPLEFLIIDEAAQLKECESTIPLQLTGLRHALLIGDDRQLPAMVKSKISEKAEFGRSLFERLVMLGHKRHLLNIQHRMHPSISIFPNREFYEDQILDGPNVCEQSYEKHFLQGKMFGSFSFIDVAYGREDYDEKHSWRNMVEVAVVAELVQRLFRESVATKQRVSVGVISPYKAQVSALQDKVGRKYNTQMDSNFSLNIRSIDGFQGGENDVIIISTVRCNGSGSVGFLSNLKRTNVALTRARYCLWVLGSGSTLLNGGSVWRKLVADAKGRGRFFDANDDKSFARANLIALLRLNHVDNILEVASKLFVDARWKVFFSSYFWGSMARIMCCETLNKVISLLEKLSDGWRKPYKEKNLKSLNGASSSLLKKVYNVDGIYNLVWTVDVLEEGSTHTQVLRIWDVLPSSQIPVISKHLDNIFSHYSARAFDRCNFKSFEGNAVVPFTWQEASNDMQSLSNQLSSLKLRNEPQTLASSYRQQWKSQLKKRN